MTSPILNLGKRSRMQRLADFLFEAGMLRKTPRTGYQFLGTSCENVAEHSFRTSIIGYILAKEAEADIARTTMLCLFHDSSSSHMSKSSSLRPVPKAACSRADLGSLLLYMRFT